MFMLESTNTFQTLPYPSWTRVQYGHATDTRRHVLDTPKSSQYFIFIFWFLDTTGHGGVQIVIFLKKRAVLQKQKVTLGHRALENQMLFSREALTCSEDAPVCCLSPHLHRQQRRPVSSLTAKAGYPLAYSSFTESYTFRSHYSSAWNRGRLVPWWLASLKLA